MEVAENVYLYKSQIDLATCNNIIGLIKDYYKNNKFELHIRENRTVIANHNDPDFNIYLKDIITFIEQSYLKETGKTIYLKGFWLSDHKPGPNGRLHSDRDHSPYNLDFEASAIAYFNSDFSGGDIEFPHLKYSLQPSTGDIILFRSYGTNYMHRVNSISSGNRYSVAMWFTTIKENRVQFLYPEKLSDSASQDA